MKHAIVIGSGIAGLAAAIRLKRLGIEVVIYEASGNIGGKISEFRIDGFRFDAGPSLFTMPELTLELLDDDLKFKVIKLDVVTKYFYPDGSRVNAFSNVVRFSGEIQEKLNVSSKLVSKYLGKSSKLFDLTADLFIFGSFHQFKNLLNLQSIKTLFSFRKLQAFKSLHAYNQQQLGEKRLVQLFDRYATYNGSNPYQTPATLSVISHLEHNMGAFFPEGGMHRITESLVQQASRLGIPIHTGQAVEHIAIDDGKIKGVFVNSTFVPAEIAVSDVDIVQFYTSLLPDKKRLAKILKEERSSSALIFYWGMKGTYPELDVHNIFFSDVYDEEFRYLFGLKDICSDPTIYVYISSKLNPTDSPEDCENWFVMVNAPANTGQNWDTLIEKTRMNILRKLENMLDKKISAQILREEILSPPDIEKQTGSVNGSLYGSSSNSRYASFNRHANFRSDVQGLYFVGGTVHPGGGIPLCLSSARIVEGLIREKMTKTGNK